MTHDALQTAAFFPAAVAIDGVKTLSARVRDPIESASAGAIRFNAESLAAATARMNHAWVNTDPFIGLARLDAIGSAVNRAPFETPQVESLRALLGAWTDAMPLRALQGACRIRAISDPGLGRRAPVEDVLPFPPR